MGNTRTFGAAHSLSKPKAKTWLEDTYLLTGIDFRPQLDMARSGAVDSGLTMQVNPPVFEQVLQKWNK